MTQARPASGTRPESRWPPTAAFAVAAGLTLLLPAPIRLQPQWPYPVIVVTALVALLVGGSLTSGRPRPVVRVVTGVLIGVVATVNAWSVVRLFLAILYDEEFTSPGALLVSGGVIWLTNVLVCALWFWHVDGGGPVARAGDDPQRPSLLFPEMLVPSLTDPDWRPAFVDYLAFSFATGATFGPADVSAIRPWAKWLSMAESTVSFVTIGLVLARAINVV